MADNEEVLDSPTGWVADHIKQYVETGGEDGHVRNGATALLLTTRGRRSGKLRRTALFYGQDGDRYLVVASKGGAPEHPLWYENLAAEPKVGIQVMADVFDATARTATPEEKAQLWPIVTKIWPAYDDYQKKTDRDIPLVIIERA
ncbi:MAG: nitroreductase family deazaflavin-dependent oxidoreductase [Chloroflexi bacterium]|nr:nitroreductase family deazaflavin-dependent oxidoreductase [Chloroflexota bacterium]